MNGPGSAMDGLARNQDRGLLAARVKRAATRLRLPGSSCLSALALFACANLLGIEDPVLDRGNVAAGHGGDGGDATTSVGRGGITSTGPASGGNTGTGVPVAACGVVFNSVCLQVCADTHCCVEQQTCLRDASCGKLLDCSDACNGDPACHSQCEETYGAGVALVGALRTCQRERCGSCPGPVMDNAILVRAQADCSKFQSCDRIAFTGTFGTLGECVARHAEEDRWIDSLPGVAWTASNLSACASTYGQMTCADYIDGALAATCLFPGTLDLGEKCSSSEQCRSSFCSYDYLTCGRCVAPPGEGQECVGGRCGAGSICNANQLCQRLRGMGEDCGTEAPCRPALSCSGGRCVEPVGEPDGSCDPTASSPCDRQKSLVCSATTNRCTPVTQFAPAGQSCGANANGVALCAMGHCRANRCVELAKDHASCNDAEGPHCQWPARCVYGICRLGSDVGDCPSSP